MVAWEKGAQCPEGAEITATEGFVVCRPAAVAEEEVFDALASLCPVYGDAESCKAGLGCEFIDASQRALLMDGTCETPEDGLCVWFEYNGNGALTTCVYQADQAFVWGTTPPRGWQSGFEELPAVCRCLDEFADR